MKFGVLSTTQNRRLAISQKVLGIPFMAIYENGARIEELTKETSTEGNIDAMIQRHIG